MCVWAAKTIERVSNLIQIFLAAGGGGRLCGELVGLGRGQVINHSMNSLACCECAGDGAGGQGALVNCTANLQFCFFFFCWRQQL